MLIHPREFDRQQRAMLAQRFDANETAMLERELTQVRAKIFEVIYAPTVARGFVPKATDIASSATTYVYKVYTPVGEVKLIAAKGNDLPRLDLTAREVTGKVRPIGGSYGWDIFEMREAARTGTPLSEMKARLAAEAIERGIDEMLAFGSLKDTLGAYPDVGCTGLANNPAISIHVPNGTFWFGVPPDPDDVYAEVSAMIDFVASSSKNTFVANTVLLATRLYNYIERTPFSALTGDSILTVLKRNHGSVTLWAPWWRLDLGGAGGLDRGIAYQRDPMTAEAVIPQEMEVMPPEWQQLEVLHHVFARCGGVKVYQPLAFHYRDWAIA